MSEQKTISLIGKVISIRDCGGSIVYEINVPANLKDASEIPLSCRIKLETPVNIN
jgi:hypothetical protein